ncbi:hypothetical protein [Devosia sediminis]|uniref:hypothetical protein n=1 Tax=Devosia sediminis TaxID=2798801 RepID=UPI001F2309B9|nr:hypothetical protein [Devosia sediminis]
MAKTVLYMSMSLDGYIDGARESIDRLHSWFFPDGADLDLDETPDRLGGVNGQVFRELMDTGAVVAGRGTFEPAKGWGGDHHNGVPHLYPQPARSAGLGGRLAPRPLCG